MMVITNLFHALSDPVRIEIVRRLSHGDGFNLSSISNNLGLTRQGARKHLAVLEKAEIIYLYKKGRNTEIRLDTNSLTQAKEFINKLEHQWDRRLLALSEFIKNNPKSR